MNRVKVTGKLLQLEETEDDQLILTLVKGASIVHIKEHYDAEDPYTSFLTLAEDVIATSTIEMVHPMKVSNFLEGIIIGVDVEFSEDSSIIENDDSRYYAFFTQEDEDPMVTLFDTGKVTFVLAE